MFSDGIGKLSWDVAEAIWNYLPPKKASPTCFQIKMGGAKGMFAVDRRLSGTVLQVRPSMVKLETDDMRDLEICDVVSKPILLVLNRQIIKTLEDMGVSDNWLFNLQNGELDAFEQLLPAPAISRDFERQRAG